jgi:hypothetical protein
MPVSLVGITDLLLVLFALGTGWMAGWLYAGRRLHDEWEEGRRIGWNEMAETLLTHEELN